MNINVKIDKASVTPRDLEIVGFSSCLTDLVSSSYAVEDRESKGLLSPSAGSGLNALLL